MKHATQHPVFIRIAAQLQNEVRQFERHLAYLVGAFNFPAAFRESAVKAFVKRRTRELGLDGKYVAH